MEILSSLHSSSISRLLQSWGPIPKSIMEKFEEMTELMTPNDNFRRYREANRKLSPSLPHLALWLQDLVFIYDGNPDNLENSIINFEKCRMVAKRIQDFEDCLALPYKMEGNPSIRQSLVGNEVWDENDVYRMYVQEIS